MKNFMSKENDVITGFSKRVESHPVTSVQYFTLFIFFEHCKILNVVDMSDINVRQRAIT